MLVPLVIDGRAVLLPAFTTEEVLPRARTAYTSSSARLRRLGQAISLREQITHLNTQFFYLSM